MPIRRSCGSAVSAWVRALPSWLAGWKPSLVINEANCLRSFGTSTAGAASAALVQIPAWTESAVTLPLVRDALSKFNDG